jgi:cytochrome c heme-lyase
MGGGISKHSDDASFQAEATTTTSEQQPMRHQEEPQQQPEKEKEVSKCPMHNKDGRGYNFSLTQMFRAVAVHGPKGSKPLSEEERAKAMANNNGGGSGGGGGGCPVKHAPSSSYSSDGGGGGCPVKARHQEYNVYSQPIDKMNNMPKGAKTQLPNPSQQIELPTDRVSSTIPKGGDGVETTWTYPSPQQFYNALSRKGKMDNTNNRSSGGGESSEVAASEEDMTSVVALHNNMNEKTWAKVVEWERQTYDETSTPKLLKFTGCPHDLSPKAAIKHYLLGHPLPYDRHDWTILRNDGTTTRYVIDYYYDETRASLSEDSAMPKLHDRSGTPSLLVDVRPALDGASPLFARAVQMPYQIMTGQTTYEMLPLKGRKELANQVNESVEVWKSIQKSRIADQQQKVAATTDNNNDKNNNKNNSVINIDEERAKEIALRFASALNDCSGARKNVANCSTEEEYSKASMDLTMCFGKTLCPVQHKTLLKILSSDHTDDDDDAKTEAALETLTECVMLKTAERRVAREQHPILFQE